MLLYVTSRVSSQVTDRKICATAEGKGLCLVGWEPLSVCLQFICERERTEEKRERERENKGMRKNDKMNRTRKLLCQTQRDIYMKKIERPNNLPWLVLPQGDKGGPLVAQAGDQWVLVGISIFNKIACSTGPVAFTRITSECFSDKSGQSLRGLSHLTLFPTVLWYLPLIQSMLSPWQVHVTDLQFPV